VGGARNSSRPRRFKKIAAAAFPSPCNDNEASPQTPPPPRFAWSPSPAFAGADKRNCSRDALASELCQASPTRHSKRASPKKKGGGAPTGAPSTDRIIGCGRAPLFSALRRLWGRVGRGHARLSALHRGTRQGRRIHHWLSSRTALPETRLDGRYPLLPVSSQPSSSETGRSAGRSGTQSRPGSGVTTPARGHRPRSVSRIVSRNALQMSEMGAT
jgi:hypothetical protein